MRLPIVPIAKTDPIVSNVLFDYGFPERQDCTISCLRLVLRYYGCDVTWEEVDQFVRRDSNGTSFNSEMARFAKSKGFDAELFGYNLYFTNPADAKLSQRQLRSKLVEARQEIQDDWYREMLDALALAMGDGVKYTVRMPTIGLISDQLKKGIPLIAQVNSSALYNRQGDPFAGHDIVLSGFERNRFYFIDPNADEEQSVTSADLLFAIASRRAIASAEYLTAIKPTSNSSFARLAERF